MKTFFIASAAVFAALAAPQVAFANTGDDNAVSSSATAEIIVSAEHQRTWDRGNRMEADGLRDLERARRDLVRYSADVVTAQDKRDTSLSRALNARQAFENLTVRANFTSGDDAKDWAKQVEELASDWDRFESRSSEGVRELDRALRRQANAQEAVDDAQAQVDEGLAMKSDAERASQRPTRR